MCTLWVLLDIFVRTHVQMPSCLLASGDKYKATLNIIVQTRVREMELQPWNLRMECLVFPMLYVLVNSQEAV